MNEKELWVQEDLIIFLFPLSRILQIIVGIHVPLVLPQVYCSHSLLFCDICFPRSVKTGHSV